MINEGLQHDTVTVLDANTEHVTKIHDDVISEGYGMIETSSGQVFNASVNGRNANKLATMLTQQSHIYINISGSVSQLAIIKNDYSVDDDSTVFATLD